MPRVFMSVFDQYRLLTMHKLTHTSIFKKQFMIYMIYIYIWIDSQLKRKARENMTVNPDKILLHQVLQVEAGHL